MDAAYEAFISYSHQDDVEVRLDGEPNHVRWAEWLYSGLMQFQTPPGAVGTPGRYGVAVPERPWPVFRDTNELPTSANLQEAITEALAASRVLVVLCSPRAVKSRYVDAEIRSFKAGGRSDRVLAVILDGEPNASSKGDPDRECFPEALRFGVREDGSTDFSRSEEPIAADLRDPDNKRELDAHQMQAQADRLNIELKRIAAGILGVPFGRLVDWEAMARRDEATDLLRKSQSLVDDAATMAPGHQYETVLDRLIESEELAERATDLLKGQSDDLDRAREALGRRRRAIFEVALSRNDLGLASYYLKRIRASGHGSEGDSFALSRAWATTDPSFSVELRSAFRAAVSIPAFTVLGIGAVYLSTDADSGWFKLALTASIFLVVAGSLSVLGFARLRLGSKKRLPSTTIATYAACLASIAALNPLALIASGILLRTCTSLSLQTLIWREP